MLGRAWERWSSRTQAPQSGPIGLDLAREWIHLAQWDRLGNDARLRAVASIPWNLEEPPSEQSHAEFRRLFREACRRHAFRRGPVVAAMPSDEVRLMVINYQAASDKADEELIATLAAERMQAPLDQHVMDYIPMRTTGERHGEKSALVAVTQEATVIRYLDLLHGAGLSVEALEVAPVAVRRVVTTIVEDERQENSLIIRCTQANTHLTVLWGRRLVMYRELDFSEDKLVERVARGLDVGWDAGRSMLRQYGLAGDKAAAPVVEGSHDSQEISRILADILRSSFYDLANQIRRALEYAVSQTHGAPIHNFLLGGVARWPGAGALLEELLGISINIMDPLTALGMDDQPGGLREDEVAADPTVALGLALRGM
jgi:type IV pilus assembly protein PilM